MNPSEPRSRPSDRLSAVSLPAPIAIAMAAAIGFEFATHLPATPFKIVLKILPVLVMAGWSLSQHQRLGRLIGVSLLAHAAGDVLIELPRRTWLIPAMSAFLLGHLLYIATFVSRFPGRRSAAWSRAIVALLLLNALGYGGWLTSQLSGPLLVAVPLYIAALTAMAVLAVRRDTGSVLPAIGAVSFVVSDAMIALRLFVLPDASWLAWLTWPTYAAAQILIPFGLWRGSRVSGESDASIPGRTAKMI